MRRRAVLVVILILMVSLAVLMRMYGGRSMEPMAAAEKPEAAGAPAPDAARDAKSGPSKARPEARKVSDEERLATLARAQIWRPPTIPVGRANLGATADPEFSCKFVVSAPGGTTPKFDCELENGETIRIKYGTGEIPSEVAATRLLRALGFGADEVTLIERLHCYGCPLEPFMTLHAVNLTLSKPLYERVIDYDKSRDMEWVARERKHPARAIKSDDVEGWAFFELDKIDPARGGAPRAHVDSLRLLAAFLAHWDNKPENQRLVCLTEDWAEGSPCPQPYLMVQDTGAMFGPKKVDLEAWRASPIWKDRASCTITLDHLPYDGATFGKVQITEPGRQHLGRLLSQLSDAQLTALFSSSRFDQHRAGFDGSRPVSDWVNAFKAKVREITDGPRCPPRNPGNTES